MSSPLISYHALPYSCFHYRAFINEYLIKGRVDDDGLGDFEIAKYVAFEEPKVNIFKPKICVDEFMSEDELKQLLNVVGETAVKKKIGEY